MMRNNVYFRSLLPKNRKIIFPGADLFYPAHYFQSVFPVNFFKRFIA